MSALSIDAIIPVLFKVIDKQIRDEYARSELGAYTQRYTARRKELKDAFREAYIHIYNQDVAKGVSRWPHPNLVEKGFKDAGNASFEWIKRTVKKGSYKTTYIPEASNRDTVEFAQTHHIVDFFTREKTAGLRELSRVVESITGKAIQFHSDLRKAKKDPKNAEDIAFRQLLHREHRKRTTTGNAALSARMQAIEVIAPGFTEIFSGFKSKDIQDIYGDIKAVYEVKPQDGFVKIKPKTEILLRIGSFRWNLSGKREQDLIARKAVFTTWAEKAARQALNKMPKSQLGALVNVDNLEAHIGNMISNMLTVNVGKATKASILRSEAGTYKGDKLSTNKSNRPVYSSNTPITKARVQKHKESDYEQALKLKNILKRHIVGQVEENMGKPALVWRTGRFSESVDILDVKMNPRAGTPSVQFQYMEDPYKVFETDENVARNPRTLIRKSIADILKSVAQTRFTLRRGEATAPIPRAEFRSINNNG